MLTDFVNVTTTDKARDYLLAEATQSRKHLGRHELTGRSQCLVDIEQTEDVRALALSKRNGGHRGLVLHLRSRNTESCTVRVT